MTKELRRCPFCGGEAKIVFAEEYKQWRIRCKNIDCDVRPSTSWFNNKEEAIDRWNRREPIDRIVEQLEVEVERARPHGLYITDRRNIMQGLLKAIEIVKGGAENDS